MLIPAWPLALSDPAGTARRHLWLPRFRRVGATQRPLTVRPVLVRVNASTYVAVSLSLNVNVVPIGGRRRFALARASAEPPTQRAADW